jgi:hypothetical protein
MTKKSSKSPFGSIISKIGGTSLSGVSRSSGSDLPRQPAGLNLGSLPSARLAGPEANSFDWGKFASKIASGGASSALKGSFGGSSLSGFGVSPLVSGIISLFTGNKNKTLPTLEQFQLPPSISQTLHVRQAASLSPRQESPIHFHIQAMDSQSIMNRSNDIAKAVKSAMLNSHPLNDVVSEI